jgi:hypothetical protein
MDIQATLLAHPVPPPLAGGAAKWVPAPGLLTLVGPLLVLFLPVTVILNAHLTPRALLSLS